MSNVVLHTDNLTKHYKDVKAVNNLSISVERGTILGILGPNGSGKTTTLGMILSVINNTSGTYSWFGNGQVSENRKRIGAVLEYPNFYPYLSATQNLVIVAKIKGIEAPEEQIEANLRMVNLYERRVSKFKTFSLGMKQRLAIASALMGDPEVLVFDEPTNGLDPQGMAEVRELIVKIASSGKTIIISSHVLDEIEKICSHVAILKEGNLLRYGPIENITRQQKQVAIMGEDMEGIRRVIESNPDIEISSMTEQELILNIAESMSNAALNKLFFDNGIVLSGIRSSKKSLEQQFIEIVK